MHGIPSEPLDGTWVGNGDTPKFEKCLSRSKTVSRIQAVSLIKETNVVRSFVYLDVAIRSPKSKGCFSAIIYVDPGDRTNIPCRWCRHFLNHFAGYEVPYHNSTVVAYPHVSTNEGSKSVWLPPVRSNAPCILIANTLTALVWRVRLNLFENYAC